jgi:hypothetical protein
MPFLLLNRFVWFGIALLMVIAGHVGAYNAGWFRGVAHERAVWEKEKASLLAAAQARAGVLKEKGEKLAAELELAKANVRTEYVEVIRTVKVKASATRACFTPDVTEILNRNSVIREKVERVGGGVTVIEHKTEAPAQSGGTSELAAAEWVLQAQAAHEQCRAQVGALAEWIRSIVGGRKA